MPRLYAEPLITAKSDREFFVFRVEDRDRCYMQAAQWHAERDWLKAYVDPVRQRRSRFAGTMVRRKLWPGSVGHFPYEIERKRIVARVGELLKSRMYDACKRFGASELPVTPSRMSSGFLGCSLSSLVEKFENQMQDGMTWDNFGARGWVIDHILPVSMFDFRRVSHIKKACHHSNLRPCWERENIQKGAKVLHGVS